MSLLDRIEELPNSEEPSSKQAEFPQMLQQRVLHEVQEMQRIVVDSPNVFIPFLRPDPSERSKWAGDISIFHDYSAEQIRVLLLDSEFLRVLEEELVKKDTQLKDSLELASLGVYQSNGREGVGRAYLHIVLTRKLCYDNVLRPVFSNG